MKPKKIKIPQYLARGKHRTYSILLFSQKKWLWSYYEYFDERYEIDDDAAAYQQVKHALAALIANSGKIAYFPIRDKGYGEFYRENYDAVLVRPELQLRRSEWPALRRQLDIVHRIKDFELYYEPEKLYDRYHRIRASEHEMAKLWRRDANTYVKLENDTVFFALRRDVCYAYHHSIIITEREVQEGYPFDYADHICDLGWMITPGCKRFMRRENEDAARKAAKRESEKV